MQTSQKLLWSLSMLVTVILTAVLLMLWSEMKEPKLHKADKRHKAQSGPLNSQKTVDDYLNAHWVRPSASLSADNAMLRLKTGIFIQSLKFFDSTEVNLTGYIWQRFRDGVHDEIKPGPDEVGFVLPEQVDSGSNIDPKEVYRYRSGDEETIGWYFEATLRQPFRYYQYPFDHKNVWVRMWPKDFSRNIVLVPDFKAYNATGRHDIFGIEETIVLGAWKREDTFFDYKTYGYNTNFGIDDYIGQHNFPELHYNFIIERKFGNAFIVHLLPLFLVAALLFAALLTVSGDPEIANRHGFNTSGLIGACSALFFVVLLAHIQLREQFAGSGIVYIEYFYFLMYAMLVLSAANTYIFSMNTAHRLIFIHYQDNLIPKVLYWPVVLGAMVALTLFVRNGGSL